MKACNVILVFMILTGCARGVGQGLPQPEQDLTAWTEFAALLKAAPFPGERIKPYQEGLREANLRVLEAMRQQAQWQEWTRTPEVFRVGQQIHYVLPMWFQLYQISGHLRQQIEPAEYRRLFEARWRDRARHGGWSVDFRYDGNDVVLHLGRRSEEQSE